MVRRYIAPNLKAADRDSPESVALFNTRLMTGGLCDYLPADPGRNVRLKFDQGYVACLAQNRPVSYHCSSRGTLNGGKSLHFCWRK
jgi:hypothetical protein